MFILRDHSESTFAQICQCLTPSPRGDRSFVLKQWNADPLRANMLFEWSLSIKIIS